LALLATVTGAQVGVIMLGGGLGAIARYLLSTSINEKLAREDYYDPKREWRLANGWLD